MLKALAEKIDTAAKNHQAIIQLSQQQSFSLEEAYEIQSLSIARRVSRDEKLRGYKLGFTSRAKMLQMGVHDLIWGRLTDAMMVEEGGVLSLKNYIHPRVEPEIAFLLKKPLHDKVSIVEALSAVEAIAPALEIIDSRYKDFKFSLEDVVADNCSSSGYVLGAWHKPDLDISNLGMIMQINGLDVQVGSSAAILGNPLRSLVAAARCLASADLQLEAGQILLAGAATAAVELQVDTTVSLLVDQLGRINFNVTV